jgi:RNA polymerase sigma-70 factor, ECF subfamily
VSPIAAERVLAEVWRNEATHAKLVGVLTRIVRDVGLAEQLANDALVAALEEWPVSGVPERPVAWLMTTAKNRALNALRRLRLEERSRAAVGTWHPENVSLASVEEALELALDQDLGDDVLRLIFTACHPILPREARVALTLRLVGGLATEAIARAFLAPEPTIAQRIVRAKKTLAAAQIPFEIPRGEDLSPRLASVLEVVYLIYNEGYYASTGDDLARPALQEEGLRLGNLLYQLAPTEPEVRGLLALLEATSARSATRTDAHGDPVLLLDQDRSRWDRSRLTRARAQGATTRARSRGRMRVRTCCRLRSPSVTGKLAPPRTPTGRRSPRSTPRSGDAPPRP